MSEVETFYKEVKYLKDRFGLEHKCSIYEFATHLIKEIHRLEDVINQKSQQGEEKCQSNQLLWKSLKKS